LIKYVAQYHILYSGQLEIRLSVEKQQIQYMTGITSLLTAYLPSLNMLTVIPCL